MFKHRLFSVPFSAAVGWVAIMLRIQEVWGSNLGQKLAFPV